MGKIIFIKGQGGMNKVGPGEDHISLLAFYYATLPSGFTSTTRVKEITDVPAAEALGIVDDKSDETKATGGNVLITAPGDEVKATGGNVLITAVGADGTIWTVDMDGTTLGTYTVLTGNGVNDVAVGLRTAINLLTGTTGYSAAGTGANVLLTAPAGLGDSINGGTHLSGTNSGAGTATVTQFSGGVNVSDWSILMDGVSIGAYTVQNGDGVNDVATALRAAINLLASTSGYSAAGSGANVALTAPAGLGDSINGGTHLSATVTHGGTSTITQFSGGVDAFYDVMHYHISEAFRINPAIKLYVGIFAIPQTWTFTELQTAQNFANGKIKNAGIFLKSVTFSTTHMTAIQAVLTTLEAAYKPISDVVYVADISSVSDLTTLSDLALLTNPKVQGNIAQDGDAVGAALFAEKGYSIGCVGATIGAISLASVHENIGWRGKFNMAAVELETPAIANGTLINSLSDNALAAIDVKNYVYLLKEVDLAGTFFNDSWTAISRTNDYCGVEANRTMDKAIRSVRSNLLSSVNGPVDVDDVSGKLAIEFVKQLESVADQGLIEMKKKKELSGFKVNIDPDQNVKTAGKIVFSIINVSTGVSRDFEIKISYATSI
jgi:hypothetical protein